MCNVPVDWLSPSINSSCIVCWILKHSEEFDQLCSTLDAILSPSEKHMPLLVPRRWNWWDYSLPFRLSIHPSVRQKICGKGLSCAWTKIWGSMQDSCPQLNKNNIKVLPSTQHITHILKLPIHALPPHSPTHPNPSFTGKGHVLLYQYSTLLILI